jgi:hypothetical protein
MPDRSRGRSQTKRDTLVLQVGGWAWGLQPHTAKTKLFRNQIISLGWMGNKWATTSFIHIFFTSSFYHSTLHRLNKWRTKRNGGWLFRTPKLTLSCSAEGKEGQIRPEMEFFARHSKFERFVTIKGDVMRACLGYYIVAIQQQLPQ